MNHVRLAILTLATFLAVLAPLAQHPPGPAAAQPTDINEDIGPLDQAGRTTGKDPKLESRLAQVAQAQAERGAPAALDEARERGVNVVDGELRVVVEAAGPQQRQAARGTIQRVGGRVEAEYAALVQARVPASALRGLAASPDVRYVRPPLPREPEAVTGQGVAASAASTWQTAGWDGTGVKIAIVDLGFAGLAAKQDSGDLPASLTTVDYCGGQLLTADNHGTAVAEIVHEMAPGAELYLICFDTEVQLGLAKEYAIAQGIHIVNHSVGWFNTSRGDGTGEAGTPDEIVADAWSNGILWVNSAGNYAQRHWSGTFYDADADDFHNFTLSDEGNTLYIPSGGYTCAFLKWDSWPVTSQDFDLYLARSSDLAIVAGSYNSQSGSQSPTESLCYVNAAASQTFTIFIHRYNATSAPRFDLFALGSAGTLEHQVAAGSLNEPGSSPSTLAAGAVCWETSSLEPYSSQGPTIDGRIKPDLAGQDSVSSATYGSFKTCGQSGFSGTSAAAPHLAGAAALVKQTNSDLSPSQLRSSLEGLAADLGASGKDSQYGAGVLALGSPRPEALAFNTQPDGAQAGTPFTTQPAVRAVYPNGQTATGFNGPVTLALKSGTGTLGASLAGTTTVNAVNGVATFAGLSIDLAGTGYLLTASSSGLTSADSSALDVTPAPKKLVFGTQPGGGPESTPFATQPVVRVTDDNDALATGFTGSVTLAIKSGTGANGATLSGTATVNAVAGQVTFSGLSIDLPATGYVLTASSSGLTSGDSNPFNITAVTPTRLVFGTQPGGATADQAFSTQPVVRAVDDGGATASTFSGSVTLAVKSGTGTSDADLSGTTTVNAVNGVATFNGLSINLAGTGYVLTASSSGLTSANSNTFTVQPSGTCKAPKAAAKAKLVKGTRDVNFKGKVKAGKGCSLVSIEWSFGDGDTATLNPVLHTYTSAGSYTARLRVQDSAGQVATSSVTLTIP